MRKWESEIFRNNHLRLMKCHIGFCAFWFVIAVGGLVYFLLNSEGITAVIVVIFVVVYSLPVLMHGLLSYGSYKKIEASRRISEFIFALLLLAFPIGTFLSMYLCLPTTQWKAPDA